MKLNEISKSKNFNNKKNSKNSKKKYINKLILKNQKLKINLLGLQILWT